MIEPNVVDEVRRRLKAVEFEDDVRVLFAVESGSRAWGFPSADSDFDVRFVYARRRDWYLSIDLETQRDVIERPIVDEIDLSGWDLRKALKLYSKSNPPLCEWLGSPFVYEERGTFAATLRRLLPFFFSRRAALYHYRHMAEGNFREYLRGEEVWLKKYLYVLRPLLAVRWLEAERTPVPMLFEALLPMCPRLDLRKAIEELVAKKKAGVELARGPRIALISDFIEAEIERPPALPSQAEEAINSSDALNELFRSILREESLD